MLCVMLMMSCIAIAENEASSISTNENLLHITINEVLDTNSVPYVSYEEWGCSYFNVELQTPNLLKDASVTIYAYNDGVRILGGYMLPVPESALADVIKVCNDLNRNNNGNKCFVSVDGLSLYVENFIPLDPVAVLQNDRDHIMEYTWRTLQALEEYSHEFEAYIFPAMVNIEVIY